MAFHRIMTLSIKPRTESLIYDVITYIYQKPHENNNKLYRGTTLPAYICSIKLPIGIYGAQDVP